MNEVDAIVAAAFDAKAIGKSPAERDDFIRDLQHALIVLSHRFTAEDTAAIKRYIGRQRFSD